MKEKVNVENDGNIIQASYKQEGNIPEMKASRVAEMGNNIKEQTNLNFQKSGGRWSGKERKVSLRPAS